MPLTLEELAVALAEAEKEIADTAAGDGGHDRETGAAQDAAPALQTYRQGDPADRVRLPGLRRTAGLARQTRCRRSAGSQNGHLHGDAAHPAEEALLALLDYRAGAGPLATDPAQLCRRLGARHDLELEVRLSPAAVPPVSDAGARRPHLKSSRPSLARP